MLNWWAAEPHADAAPRRAAETFERTADESELTLP